MDTFIINKFLHNRFAYATAIFLYIFIFYMIFEHMYDLTKLIFKYNAAFDYGKYSKKACANEFFEFETERFHVNDKADDIKLSNTTNKQRYITFILVITIIITLFISFTFSYIIYNTFFNKDWLYQLLDIKVDAFEKRLNGDSSMFQRVFAYMIHVFTLLYSPIKIISGLFYKLFISNENTDSLLKNIFLFFIVTLIYILVAAIFVIMPLYIGLKLGLDIDISPFNPNHQVYIPYIVAFSLILLIRLAFMYFKYSKTYIENYDPIIEYFSTNVDNMYTANNAAGYIAFFAIFAIYILMFYILGNVINLHNKPLRTDISEEEKQEIYNVNSRQNIINVFMKKTIGYGEFNNYQLSNVFIKNISGISFTLVIVIIVMLILYYLISVSGGNQNVHRLMKYAIITPLTLLTIVIMTTSTTTEFNSMVNDYIFEFPNKVYRQYIDIANKLFNNFIGNEYAYADNVRPQYICRNVGNAILLTLLNELFNGVSNISRTGDKDGVPIDITPEFKYDEKCEYLEPFNFSQGNEYNISYYMNGKELKKNIFYNYSKCSDINTSVLETISSNLQIFSSEQLAQIMKKIQQVFYVSKPLKTEDPIQYIRLQIVENDVQTNTNIENLRYKLKRKIHKCIFNVKNNLTCSDMKKTLIHKKDDKYYENDIEVKLTNMEVDKHNNNISGEFQNANAEQVVGEYNQIVDDIIDIYLNVIYHHLYAFTPFFMKLNINKDTKSISKDNDKYQDLQDIFIKKLSNGITETFDKIKEKLSSPLVEGNVKNLSTYIISNYNSIHTDKIYRKEQLMRIDATSHLDEENKSKNKNIEIFDEIYNLQYEIYIDKLKPLMGSFKTNEYKNVKFIITLKNIKSTVKKLREELNKYKYDDAFIGDVNSIFRNEDNKYISSYDIIRIQNDKTTVEIIDSAFNALDKTMELLIIMIADMEMKYNLLVKKNIGDADKTNIEKYGDNLDRYDNVIETNNYALKNDLFNAQALANKTINTTSELSDMNIDLSRNTLNESKKVDKLIYLVCINYLISIILTNFIYNI